MVRLLFVSFNVSSSSFLASEAFTAPASAACCACALSFPACSEVEAKPAPAGPASGPRRPAAPHEP
eukprot:2194029-Lingulodinium_polyedra.AAC.1